MGQRGELDFKAATNFAEINSRTPGRSQHLRGTGVDLVAGGLGEHRSAPINVSCLGFISCAKHQQTPFAGLAWMARQVCTYKGRKVSSWICGLDKNPHTQCTCAPLQHVQACVYLWCLARAECRRKNNTLDYYLLTRHYFVPSERKRNTQTHTTFVRHALDTSTNTLNQQQQ